MAWSSSNETVLEHWWKVGNSCWNYFLESSFAHFSHFKSTFSSAPPSTILKESRSYFPEGLGSATKHHPQTRILTGPLDSCSFCTHWSSLALRRIRTACKTYRSWAGLLVPWFGTGTCQDLNLLFIIIHQSLCTYPILAAFFSILPQAPRFPLRVWSPLGSSESCQLRPRSRWFRSAIWYLHPVINWSLGHLYYRYLVKWSK